jgi:RNA 2',3'-cyclic 3'-phosphodiesterase
MSDVIRTFIAIELPAWLKTAIAGVQKSLKRNIPGIRWTAPDNIHLTLAFLGDVRPEDTVRISGALSETAGNAAPFSLHAKGLGAFPGLSRPRVIWMGIGGDAGCLEALSRDLNDHLETIGFSAEKRRFSGHLTLGRVKDNINVFGLMDCVKEMKNFETPRFTVNEAILMKSDLRSAGPVYTKIHTSVFTGGIRSV